MTGDLPVGESAALATAVLWAGTALLFGAAARRGGPDTVNLLRLVAATLVLGVVTLATGAARSLPTGQVVCLAGSGLVGLALGDVGYFRALQILGPRRAALMMSLAPALAAALMVPLLHEGLRWIGGLGMATTLAGVAWVQSERAAAGEVHGSARTGVLWGLLGAAGQASGMVLSKVGLGAAPAGAPLAEWSGLAARGELSGVPADALYGTFLRMAAATVAIGGAALLGYGGGRLRESIRDRRFLLLVGAATVTGPVLGVWLSLVAVQHANTAVASTIIATSPVFVIPLVRVFHGTRTSARGWLGALLALIGVAVLAFRGLLAA